MSTFRNIKLFAKEKDNRGFDIYLDISGEPVYLMSHRSNPLVLRLLGDGITLPELDRSISRLASGIADDGKWYTHGGMNPRLKSRRNYSRKVENSVRHIRRNAELYLNEISGAA